MLKKTFPWEDSVEFEKPSKQLPAYKNRRVKTILYKEETCENCNQTVQNRRIHGELAKNGKTFKYLCKSCNLWQDPYTKLFTVAYGYQVEELLKKKR